MGVRHPGGNEEQGFEVPYPAAASHARWALLVG